MTKPIKAMNEQRKSELKASAETYLAQKEGVSSAELQYNLKCSYKEVRELLAQLTSDLILEEREGIYYVNSDTLSKATLELEEIFAIRSYLNKEQIDFIDSLLLARSLPITQGRMDIAEKLIEYGVVAAENNKLHLKITVDTATELASMEQSAEDVFRKRAARECAKIIYLADCKNAAALPAVKFVSAALLGQVGFYLKRYKANKMNFAEINPSISFKNAKYIFIESFLQRNNFETAEEYHDRAEYEINALSNMGLKESELYREIKEAALDICDLTIKEIDEIKRIISED